MWSGNRSASLLTLLAMLSLSSAFTPSYPMPTCIGRTTTSLKMVEKNYEQTEKSSRRSFFLKATKAAALVVLGPLASPSAQAAIDPNALKSLPVEGDNTGAASRIKQLEASKGPQPGDLEDIPFTKLESGVQYREYREGKGNAGARGCLSLVLTDFTMPYLKKRPDVVLILHPYSCPKRIQSGSRNDDPMQIICHSERSRRPQIFQYQR